MVIIIISIRLWNQCLRIKPLPGRNAVYAGTSAVKRKPLAIPNGIEIFSPAVSIPSPPEILYQSIEKFWTHTNGAMPGNANNATKVRHALDCAGRAQWRRRFSITTVSFQGGDARRL
jgi:hypothetical protein